MSRFIYIAASGDSAGDIIVGLIIMGVFLVFVLVYALSPRVRAQINAAFADITKKTSSQSAAPLRRLTDEEKQRLLNSVGMTASSNGYMPQMQAPGFASFMKQEHERPSAIIAVLLFFLCFIPGVVYLARGQKVVTRIVSVQLSDGPAGTIINVNGPGNIKKQIQMLLLTYQAQPIPGMTP